MKRAISLANEVVLFAYGQRAAQVWRKSHLEKLADLPKLTIWYLSDESLVELATFASRTMTLQVTLQDGIIWFSNQQQTLELRPELWLQTILSK